MRSPSPALEALARRLVADDTERRRDEPQVVADAADEVFGTLRDRLVMLIGARGFEALLERALKLAKAEDPALEAVQVTPGGGLTGLRESVAGRTAEEGIEVSTRLLARFLDLLATFIGVDLTAHLANTIRGEGRGVEEK